MMQASLTPEDTELAKAMLAEGTGTIRGSALMRQRGGGVVTCAGNQIYLIPATQSATKEMRRLFGGDEGWVPRGGDAVFGGGTLVLTPEPNRKTVCNAQGFFTFANVRAGKWYLLTSVVWTVGDDYQGGAMLGSAELAEGKETEVVLSQ
jgi:hypothetical protein